MREYEIGLEIFEGKGATVVGDDFPNLAEEGLCAWMLGDEEEPEKKAGGTSSDTQRILGSCVRGLQTA